MAFLLAEPGPLPVEDPAQDGDGARVGRVQPMEIHAAGAKRLSASVRVA